MDNDMISREALKKAITEATYNFEQIPIRVDEVQEIIDNVPTVEARPKEAFYFFDNRYLHMFTCSRCFMPEPQINEFYTKKIAFCAFCGAKITHKDKGDAAPELIRGVERRLNNQMKTFTEAEGGTI